MSIRKPHYAKNNIRDLALWLREFGRMLFCDLGEKRTLLRLLKISVFSSINFLSL